MYLYKQGFTNADNPFGDERLLDTFVWGKKLEKEGKKHLDKDEIHQHQKVKREESRVGLLKLLSNLVSPAKHSFVQHLSVCVSVP